jgi:uncharacterized phage infection (PIP) family protein YhgE
VNSINNSFSKLNTTKVKGPSGSTKNLRKSSSKTRKKQQESQSGYSTAKSTAGALQRSSANLRDKLSGLELNIRAVKENVDTTDKNLEKVLRQQQRQTDGQIELIKDSVMRLAEMMSDELSSVRQEL